MRPDVERSACTPRSHRALPSLMLAWHLRPAEARSALQRIRADPRAAGRRYAGPRWDRSRASAMTAAVVVQPRQLNGRLLTTDLLTEGIHFDLAPPASRGHRLSGGRGQLQRHRRDGRDARASLLVALAVPRSRARPPNFSAYRGMMQPAVPTGSRLIGGDTSASSHGLVLQHHGHRILPQRSPGAYYGRGPASATALRDRHAGRFTCRAEALAATSSQHTPYNAVPRRSRRFLISTASASDGSHSRRAVARQPSLGHVRHRSIRRASGDLRHHL